jgi:hypothetical protein
MSETTPKVVGLGGKGYDPKAFHASAGTKVLYSVPKSSDKFFRTPYNNIAGLSPDGVFADYIAPGITGPTSISVNENTTPIHVFSADETVTWSKSGADTSKFTLNSSTGELVFASAPDYETPTDADGNNIYQVVITATDASGNASSQTLDVTVLDVDEFVTTNLLFHFDAADSSSGDSTWTDKTSNNYVMTANGSPTYSSSDGGSWDFNGSSQYFENSSDIGTSSAPSAMTLIAFVKRDGNQSSWTGLVYGRQNSYINSGRGHGLHLYGANPYIGFSWNNSWDNNSNLTIPDDEWCMVAVTMESGDNDFYLYKDSGITTASNTATLTGSYLDQGTWIWRIARDANADNRYWDGKIAIALAYTSKLTQTELTQIWDAHKSRYGY